MAGLGDGVLGEGVLGESSSEVTYAADSPPSMTFTVQPAIPLIIMNVTVGAGTPTFAFTVNAPTVGVVGNVTIEPDLCGELEFSVNSVSVQIASVNNVTIGANTISMTMAALTPAYVGSMIAVGLVEAGFSVSQPEIGFSVSQPGISFTVH